MEGEDSITIRRIPGEDSHIREVRISCSDATGLGLDVMRLLLDFGLRILQADLTTDGIFCFIVLKVALGLGVTPRWSLLKTRLDEAIPSETDVLRTLCQIRPKQQQPFSISVSGYDKQGVLHTLTQVLWEADTTVFQAHATTAPNTGRVHDVFWVYDNRDELPQQHRVIEICDRIRTALGPEVLCTIEPITQTCSMYDHHKDGFDSFFQPSSPLPPYHTTSMSHAPSSFDAFAIRRRRLLGKDAASSQNLKDIVDRKRRVDPKSAMTALDGAGVVRHSSLSGEFPAPFLNSFNREPIPMSPAATAASAEVAVEVDNATSTSYTMISLRCKDRKGLLYDIFLKLKEVNLRVAFARVDVDPSSSECQADLFVQEAEGSRISDPDILTELTGILSKAAAFPFRIEVNDTMEGAATEVKVAAEVDAGGRGRPRVTYDVTQGLSSAGVGVYCADVYVENTRQPSSPHVYPSNNSNPHATAAAPPSSDDAMTPFAAVKSFTITSSSTSSSSVCYPLSPSDPLPAGSQEMHRFLVHLPHDAGGGGLRTEHDRQLLLDMVKSSLMGTQSFQTAPVQWTTVANDMNNSVHSMDDDHAEGAPGMGSNGGFDAEGNGGGALSFSSSGKSGLLRTLSTRWKGDAF